MGKSGVSSIATGGGGDLFEQQVAAYALGLLLLREIPPILTDCFVVEIHLQSSLKGWHTDDILIVCEGDRGQRRQLGLQVRRSFSVTNSDKESCSAIIGMWNDFWSNENFNRNADQLAIVVLQGTSVLMRDFNSLLDCARASRNIEDFHLRTSLNGHLSKKAKKQFDVIRTILTENENTVLNDETLWQFLRSINVLYRDFSATTAQAKADILTRLSSTSKDRDESNKIAQNSWRELLECAGEGRPVAKSFTYEDLPLSLRKQHAQVKHNDHNDLRILINHGQTVRATVRRTIWKDYHIDRTTQLQSLTTMLQSRQTVIVSGVAGSGKSALVCDFLEQIREFYPVFSFKAEEFAKPHVDEVFANAQTSLHLQRFAALLAAHDRKVLFIDGTERLLENPVRDAFVQLIEQFKTDPTLQILLTVRDYSLETVRHALIPSELDAAIFEVLPLNDDELETVLHDVPHLSKPLENIQLRWLLRIPYILDLASRLDWDSIPLPNSVAEFRNVVWQHVIRREENSARGLPNLRENVFLDIVLRRAIELRPFIDPSTSNAEALSALMKDSLVSTSGGSSRLVSVAHDVLEDWGVLHWLNQRYEAAEGSLSILANDIDGYPALRRGFRQWLTERLQTHPSDSQKLVLRSIEQSDLPPYFKDDCLVAALLSDSVIEFIDRCELQIVKGNISLLERIVRVLCTACKESPKWLDEPGIPSIMLIPMGKGWTPILGVIKNLIDVLLPTHAVLILGVVEDWAKQINWLNKNPDGIEEAGIIVDKLLNEFEEYRYHEQRKRALEVALKIPRAVSRILELFELALSKDQRDWTVREFRELVLLDSQDGLVCQGFPDKVISVINAQLLLSDCASGYEFLDVDETHSDFGVYDDKYFPPSALQGPFNSLLTHHPQKAVDFIISFVNHAANWYGKNRSLERTFEPVSQISLEIVNCGTVKQWANCRLYCLYRASQVGPASITSILMALEARLLHWGKMDDINLEDWLIYLLKKSNNVMVTGVVASVCTAFPEKAEQAAFTLLGSRDILQLDRQRLALESSMGFSPFEGLNPSYKLFEQERKTSNELPHRSEDLEVLGLKMQLTKHRADVWAIIDRHRQEMSRIENEDTKSWRLALHRMDIRDFEPRNLARVEDEKTREETIDHVYFGPGKLEPDVQEMVDTVSQKQAKLERYLGLQNRARSAWETGAKTKTDKFDTSLLDEARAIENEGEGQDDLCRIDPALVAAVYLRDHINNLNDQDFQWCANQINFEVRRLSSVPDDVEVIGQSLRSDYACARVVPILATTSRECDDFDPIDLLALSLTHPIDALTDCTYVGLGSFVGNEHKQLILQCLAASLYRVSLGNELQENKVRKGFIKRFQKVHFPESIMSKVRTAIKKMNLDFKIEFQLLDFKNRYARTAMKHATVVLEQHPEWQEARHYFSWLSEELVDVWCSKDKSNGGVYRNYQFEIATTRAIASFVLRLPRDDALRVSAPIVNVATTQRRDVSWFVTDLILNADRNTQDCFWDVWQAMSKSIVHSTWGQLLTDEHSNDVTLLNAIFLNNYWEKDVKHWYRLDGYAHLLDELVHHLPSTIPVLLAYCKFLFVIGHKSLPGSFVTVANVMKSGDEIRMASHSDIALVLETLLGPYVYSHPHLIKTDASLREAVLVILNALVEGGSSSAYRMRDDFVTP